jgi:hypothetical protein
MLCAFRSDARHPYNLQVDLGLDEMEAKGLGHFGFPHLPPNPSERNTVNHLRFTLVATPEP